jgi:hypothetical protein
VSLSQFVLPLGHARISKVNIPGHTHCIRIESPELDRGRELILSCSSEREQSRWVDALERATVVYARHLPVDHDCAVDPYPLMVGCTGRLTRRCRARRWSHTWSRKSSTTASLHTTHKVPRPFLRHREPVFIRCLWPERAVLAETSVAHWQREHASSLEAKAIAEVRVQGCTRMLCLEAIDVCCVPETPCRA